MPELSVIIPTYNERENIAPLLEALDRVLTGVSWEVIFVDDDSPDGTSALVREIAGRDTRVRCVQRLGRRGLSSACIEGMLACAAPVICVMDADLQHDESILPAMLQQLRERECDIVIGSRYLDEGSLTGLSPARGRISRFATWLSQRLLRVRVTDPMSGFFMLSRGYFEQVMHRLSGRGFKILLDILVSGHTPARIHELPYGMRSRVRGQSKLDVLVVWDFLVLVLSRAIGRLLPYRFLSFVLVGFTGLTVHLIILWLLYERGHAEFMVAQSVATLVAMTGNYILNNRFTFHDQRKHGLAFWRGLFGFYLVCMFGAIVNIALATSLYEHALMPWVLAGGFGAVAGAVWNFTTSSLFVWNRDRRTDAA